MREWWIAMRARRPFGALALVTLVGAAVVVATWAPMNVHAEPAADDDWSVYTWPPELPGFEDGVASLESDGFLEVTDAVRSQLDKECAVEMTIAEVPPRVELALHGDLPHDGRNRTGWSTWGDIGVASDGRVYSSIGCHGDDAGGTSHALIYEWDPQTSTLRQVVDVNAVSEREGGEPTWSKVHARIDEGPDGWIYFSGTLNDGRRAGQERFQWSDTLPGGQLMRYHPDTGESEVFANLPRARATATSLLDRERGIWWCNLEAGEGDRYRGDALYAIDLSTGEPIFRTDDDTVRHNRNFALASDGTVIFNGPGSGTLWRADPETGEITQTGATLPDGAVMRASTRESSDGHIYGMTHRPGRLFRYTPATDEIEMLGYDFECGTYSAVIVMSPDERFLYWMPGAHGAARGSWTPVVQYHIATGTRKIIAFLRAPFEETHHYVPSGTYGIKMSPDGRTLYANLNGQALPEYRREGVGGNAFGLTSFAAIHIPDEELRDPE